MTSRTERRGPHARAGDGKAPTATRGTSASIRTWPICATGWLSRKSCCGTKAASLFRLGTRTCTRLEHCWMRYSAPITSLRSSRSRRKRCPCVRRTFFTMCDYLLWYAKDRDKLKFRKLFMNRDESAEGDFQYVETPSGAIVPTTDDAAREEGARQFQSMDLRSSGRTESCVFSFDVRGPRVQSVRRTKLENQSRRDEPVIGSRSALRAWRLPPVHVMPVGLSCPRTVPYVDGHPRCDR